MHKLGLLKFRFYFVCLFMLQIFLSCNLNADPSIDEAFSQQLSIKEFEQQVAQVKDLNNRGTTARNIANYKEALNLHFQALNLAEAAKDTVGQIYALNNLGTDLRRTYSNLEASTYHYLALEFSVSNKKHSKTRALAMNGLGNIFLSLNKHKQAKSYFQRALAIEQELKSNLGIAINYANLAETYSMSNDLDSALYYYNESLKQNKLIDSNIGEAICKRAMGIIYYKKQNIAFALQLLNEAFIIMKDSKDAFHKLEVQISLA